ncbi:hypothetical protein AMQ84_24910 [Paenibacillus riograndensis]|uniref:Uncharacterized protein n=1 Tax=Paenibacillus riograndensis TaxID=483937 RepID=A0A132TNA2_9BACL|nr:hypothetical protein AMQ84_24910 [Paenibacillus riograndensis]
MHPVLIFVHCSSQHSAANIDSVGPSHPLVYITIMAVQMLWPEIINMQKPLPPWKPSNISGEKGLLALRLYLLKKELAS